MAQQWTEGGVVEIRAFSGRHFALRVDAAIEPFQAGQFTKLGLKIDGEIVGRPYSLVNDPGDHTLEFYFNVVAGGPLSGRLAALTSGERVLVAPRASGFLILSEVPRAPQLWMMATGTGIGPFISILKGNEVWERFERVILVHAVRHAAELAYRDVIAQAQAQRSGSLAYIPFVSREPCDFALSGRIPQAIADGRLEARADTPISAAGSQFMLCGNPEMVRDASDALIARGLKKHRRRDPGQITVENYW